MSDGRFCFTVFSDSGSVVGFLSSWELEGFTFIEHFAVRADRRGRGIGKEMLAHFLEGRENIVLEVEPPGGDIQNRRIAFYKRLGFVLNPYDYIQPPYGESKKPVHLLLMSRPGALDRDGFAKARAELHLGVYGLRSPMV